MELRQLRYFVTTAQSLNFSDAARQLFITQGTLSQQIKQLEDEMGCILFSRNSHRVELTEAGQEMLPLAIKTLEDSQDCLNRIADIKKGLSGTLRIGLTSSFKYLMTDTVKSFLKEYPGINLVVHYKTASELIDLLEEREIDFAVAFKSAVNHENIESEPLFESDLSAIMRKGHPLSDKKIITIEELERQSIALPGSGLQARKAFERFVDTSTLDLNVRVELNDPNIIIELVRGTNLVSILSTLAIYYEPMLVAIPIEGMQRKMVGCAHWLKEAYRKKSAVAFLEMLKESVRLSSLQSF